MGPSHLRQGMAEAVVRDVLQAHYWEGIGVPRSLSTFAKLVEGACGQVPVIPSACNL